MSKTKILRNIVRSLIRAVIYLIKVVATWIPRLLGTLWANITKRLRFSITFKTAITYGFIFTKIFIGLSVLITVAFGAFLLYGAEHSLEKDAAVLAQRLADGGMMHEEELKTFANLQGIEVTLVDTDREITFRTGPEESIPWQALEQREKLAIATQKLYVVQRVTNNEAVADVVVARHLFREFAYWGILMVGLFFIFILALMYTLLRGSKTLKRMLKPIDEMIKTARSISASDLNTRLNVTGSHDELKDLAETFNEMLDRIQGAYEQQNQFVSDASHELRTPIAVIQGYANLLQRWGKADQAVLEESVEAIRNEANSMKELVERLLFLARADRETQKVAKAQFGLHELVDEVVRETRLIDSNHEICGESNPQIVINADRGLIKQALRILVDNSLKYTPTGGKVSISSNLGNQQVKIRVEDNGIGISAQDLPLVFNRFYKCDKSRTRESGGTGLGLSIAKWIVEKHGGTIGIDSALGRGTTVTISLPL